MKKIIIVEDEPLVKKGLLLTTPWNQYGCEVIGDCNNGIEGIDLIRKIQPDIVITDIRMPKMDGISMIEALQDQIHVEYIIISGFNEFEYARKAMHYGVKEYLVKPVEDADLANAILNAVKQVDLKKEILRLRSMKNMEWEKIAFFSADFNNNKGLGQQKNIDIVLRFIREHFFEEITVADAAKIIFVSESYLSRLLKSQTNYTFNEYLSYYRLQKACEFLRQSNIKIYEVAGSVGYKDQRYFSVLFKKNLGMTPKEYRDAFCLDILK